MRISALLPALCLGCVAFALPPEAPPSLDAFVGPGPSENLPPALAAGLRGLQPRPLANHIAFLTHPEQQGRGLGTRGLEATARYLAARMAKAGLSPMGKSYFQTVPLQKIRELGGELRIELPGGKTAFTWKHGGTCRLPELEPQALTAGLVFAGYGIREEGLGHDDFRDLDVKGKIVLLMGGLPPGPQWQRPELQARYASEKDSERYAARIELLDQLGARAVIALEAGLDKPSVLPKAPSEPFFRAAPGVVVTDEPPLVRLSVRQAEGLLAGLGVDLLRPETVRARALPGAQATLQTTGKVQPAASRNVLAVLMGSDPRLRREAVLLGAHMDHLGMPGGVLHPGADDNASGVAALLEIARAFATSPARPRRTVIFAFWTGEEDGKFGSGHYVRHPLWPLAQTSAYLNLDMIGHPWTAEELRKLVMEADPGKGAAFLARVTPADFAEPGFADWVPELAPILAQAGRSTGLALHLDPTDGRSGGSDYRDFARVRVPFIRFFGNYFPGYHEPGDTAESLDTLQVQKMARLAFATAWLLAER